MFPALPRPRRAKAPTTEFTELGFDLSRSDVPTSRSDPASTSVRVSLAGSDLDVGIGRLRRPVESAHSRQSVASRQTPCVSVVIFWTRSERSQEMLNGDPRRPPPRTRLCPALAAPVARPRACAARRAGSCRRWSSAAWRTPAGGRACRARASSCRSREMLRAISALSSTPGLSTTKAFGTESRSGSGLGTTAASATASCSTSTLSSSNGLMR